jgi:hypothetical protein
MDEDVEIAFHQQFDRKSATPRVILKSLLNGCNSRGLHYFLQITTGRRTQYRIVAVGLRPTNVPSVGHTLRLSRAELRHRLAARTRPPLFGVQRRAVDPSKSGSASRVIRPFGFTMTAACSISAPSKPKRHTPVHVPASDVNDECCASRDLRGLSGLDETCGSRYSAVRLDRQMRLDA